MRLEPDEGKLLRPVLRGGVASNGNSLPDQSWLFSYWGTLLKFMADHFLIIEGDFLGRERAYFATVLQTSFLSEAYNVIKRSSSTATSLPTSSEVSQ